MFDPAMIPADQMESEASFYGLRLDQMPEFYGYVAHQTRWPDELNEFVRAATSHSTGPNYSAVIADWMRFR